MLTPTHQRIVRAFAWLFGGVLGVGAVLDAFTNAFSLPPWVLVASSACVVLLWLALEVVARVHKIKWRFENGVMSISRPGRRHRFAAAGVVALLVSPLATRYLNPPP